MSTARKVAGDLVSGAAEAGAYWNTVFDVGKPQYNAGLYVVGCNSGHILHVFL